MTGPLVALLALVLLLSIPWVLMPKDPTSEIGPFERVLWCINRFYCGFWHRLEIDSADTLPVTGPAILICNHTCCIDHLLLQASTDRVLGFLIAKEYFDYWLFKPLCKLAGCIPVNRDGNDLTATRTALRAIAEGRVVPIFPEGHITPTSGREMDEGKPGAAYLAVRARVPVIPAYLRGTPATDQVVPSLFWPSHVHVVFGPPVDLSDLLGDGKGHLDRDKLPIITERLMDAIRALRDRAYPPSGPISGDSHDGDGKARPSAGANGDGTLSERPLAVGRP